MDAPADPLALARACAERMLATDDASRGLGMEIEIPAVGEAIVRMTVRTDMANGHAICHGGFIFTLADSAFAFACNAYNRLSVASAASVDFLAPARVGDKLIAHATQVRHGHRNGVYDVTVRRVDGTRIAVFRGRSVTKDIALVGPDAPSTAPEA